MNKSLKKIGIVCLTIMMLSLFSSCYRTSMPNRFLKGTKQIAIVESFSRKQYNWEQTNNYLIMQTNGEIRAKWFPTYGDEPCILKEGDTITVYVLDNGELDSPSFYW